MVSSIVHGTTGVGAPGVDTRYGQRHAPAPHERERAASADRVELSAASLAAARESVREGIGQVQQALALGRDAMALLLKAQSAARGEATEEDLGAALTAFSQRLDAAMAGGAQLAAGRDVTVRAEPDTAPVVIRGVDLRLNGEVIQIGGNARADDPALMQTAQRSLEKLQEEMSRLADAMRALEAHQGFLGAVETAAGVRRDIDTDGARLLALQVRQRLEAAGAPSIANVEPQAVLTLFRAGSQ